MLALSARALWHQSGQADNSQLHVLPSQRVLKLLLVVQEP
jgi:hypothetical protein